MYFLIDYENVKNAGMRGTDYLQANDSLILFFSKFTPNMETRYLLDIQKSGCFFDTCKLVKTQKNGLDFYIASRLGEIFGQGYRGNAVIVSKDTGFQAVKDYWTSRAKPAHKVVLSESIEQGIIAANEHDERTEQIRTGLKPADISTFFADYQEELRLRQLLQEVFSDTEYIDRTAEMEEIIKSSKTAKVVYLSTLHCFGRKDGLAVYQRLKNCAKL